VSACRGKAKELNREIARQSVFFFVGVCDRTGKQVWDNEIPRTLSNRTKKGRKREWGEVFMRGGFPPV